jgi:hypothetical protein
MAITIALGGANDNKYELYHRNRVGIGRVDGRFQSPGAFDLSAIFMVVLRVDAIIKRTIYTLVVSSLQDFIADKKSTSSSLINDTHVHSRMSCRWKYDD